MNAAPLEAVSMASIGEKNTVSWFTFRFVDGNSLAVKGENNN